MKIYIACTLSRLPDHNAIRDHLLPYGIELTHDWTRACPWVAETMDGIHGREAWDRMSEIEQTANAEIEGVRDADILVALVDQAGRGTHCELGAALTAGIPVLLIGTEDAIWGEPYTCAFYHHELSKHLILDIDIAKGQVNLTPEHLEAIRTGIQELEQEFVPGRYRRKLEVLTEMLYDGLITKDWRQVRDFFGLCREDSEKLLSWSRGEYEDWHLEI